MKESQELINILKENKVNGFENPGGTDKATIHSYTGVYEFLLSPYRNLEEVSLLEIGVQWGGSSILWQKFLPNSNSFLVDIKDQRHKHVIDLLDKERFRFYEMDGYLGESKDILMNDCPGGFDIIIDDGPHTLDSQVKCINHYFPMLKKGGVLIIEDIQSFDHMEILKEFVPKEYQENVKIFDLRSIKQRYDDLMFVIHK